MDSTSPYRHLDARAVWKRSVGCLPWEQVLPVPTTTEAIPTGTRVASAGSCFAQKIAQRLPSLGLEYLVTEPGPSFLAPSDRFQLGYGVYSARYGNIYTAAQLLQLLERASGRFEPAEPCWRTASGTWVDPLRPGINTIGFASESECLADRTAHLDSVRRLFQAADVFIFTLGLTESWRCKEDGAVLPVCPGSGHGGRFDHDKYEFVNFGYREIVAQLETFLDLVRAINPGLRLVLTVSPVPLIATFTDEHVLTATTYSKSVLRAAAGELCACRENVDYFASYEIVSQAESTWAFEPGRRVVSDRAVEQVTECFRRQFLDDREISPSGGAPTEIVLQSAPTQRPLCDEDEILAAMAARKER